MIAQSLFFSCSHLQGFSRCWKPGYKSSCGCQALLKSRGQELFCAIYRRCPRQFLAFAARGIWFFCMHHWKQAFDLKFQIGFLSLKTYEINSVDYLPSNLVLLRMFFSLIMESFIFFYSWKNTEVFSESALSMPVIP